MDVSPFCLMSLMPGLQSHQFAGANAEIPNSGVRTAHVLRAARSKYAKLDRPLTDDGFGSGNDAPWAVEIRINEHGHLVPAAKAGQYSGGA